MSHILALYGTSNCGKTSTIKEVFEQLKIKYPKAAVRIEVSGPTDIKVYMDIKSKKIGIESQGDPNSRLEESLKDFVSKKCDVIFCATRTRGMTVDWVNKYTPTHKIDFIAQPVASKTTHLTSNKKSASNLIKMAGL